MKKLFFVSIALLSVLVFSACSSDDSVAKRLEGTYIVDCHTNVDIPSESAGAFRSDVKLVVKAEADDFVKIVIPTTIYERNGQDMRIPEFAISGVPVVDNLENGIEIPMHSFLVDGIKKIKGTITGEFDEYGQVEVVLEYKYGNMPYAIKQSFLKQWIDMEGYN